NITWNRWLGSVSVLNVKGYGVGRAGVACRVVSLNKDSVVAVSYFGSVPGIAEGRTGVSINQTVIYIKLDFSYADVVTNSRTDGSGPGTVGSRWWRWNISGRGRGVAASAAGGAALIGPGQPWLIIKVFLYAGNITFRSRIMPTAGIP